MKDSQNDIQIGLRLESFRKQLKLTQTEMERHAKEYGFANLQSKYSLAERGLQALQVDMLRFLVTRYNLNAYWLLTGEGKSIRGEEPKKTLVTDMKILIDEIHLVHSRLERAEKIIQMLNEKVANLMEKV